MTEPPSVGLMTEGEANARFAASLIWTEAVLAITFARNIIFIQILSTPLRLQE
jgi:hypothetical protein